MDSESKITIGVEMEFLVCDLPENLARFGEFDIVINTLKPVANELGVNIVETGRVLDPAVHLPSVFESFHIQDDSTIVPDEVSQKGVEIATPIFRNGKWEHGITAICKALKKSFRVGFNGTTGLHVHIGIGEKFTLKQLKSISKAIILFESQLDTYHQPWRSAGPLEEDPKSFIKSCRHNRIFRNLTNLECMTVIDKAGDIDELLERINCSPVWPHLTERHYKYNLTCCKDYKTIEFRQAAGSVDEAVILDWIHRIIMLVNCAISTSDEIFAMLARVGINDPEIYKQFGVPVHPELIHTPVFSSATMPPGWR